MDFETLTLAFDDVLAEIVHLRGAIVSRLCVRGREILFLDRATLNDLSKNVRGGIPILFPFAGKLEHETLQATGTVIKQHGFGRNMPWNIDEHTRTSVRLSLSPDADAKAVYPFNFRAEYTVLLLPHGLQLELQIANTGDKALPIAPGWHPYFQCVGPLKESVSGDVSGFSADKLNVEREFDFGLPAPENGRARFEIPGLGALRISFCPEMKHLQFWSLPGKDFICIEPFRGPNNTINTAQRLDLQPAERRTLWMRIELDEN